MIGILCGVRVGESIAERDCITTVVLVVPLLTRSSREVWRNVLGETLLLPLLDRGNATLPSLDALALRCELCGDSHVPTGCQSLVVFLAINDDHLKIVD